MTTQLETTHTYVQQELTRLIAVAERLGLASMAMRLLQAKDSIRRDHYAEVTP